MKIKNNITFGANVREQQYSVSQAAQQKLIPRQINGHICLDFNMFQ